MASIRSAASSAHSASRPTSSHDISETVGSIPVETLVQHLLDAKRSLSSMRLVLHANDLVHLARQAHEESVVLAAQSQFLRRGISDQVRILLKVRRSMNKTYESGKREFKQVIRELDLTHGRLEDTINVLRGRVVDSAFRPEGEGQRNLLDFVDELQVDTMRNALKENIAALQVSNLWA
jgi:autophagy-related protein 17